MEIVQSSGSAKTSMAMLFSRTLKTLPADLAEFVKYSKTNPDILFTEQTLDRLVQIVLNEQDTRISTKATKLQVIEILKTIAGVDREHRYALRPILQGCRVWFDDEVDPEVRERTMKDGHGELLPERDKELVMRTKLIFALCWKTPPVLLKSLVQDESLRIEQCKLVIQRQYAATAMQSIVRSKMSRGRLKRTLLVQAAEQEEESRQWSALILQKVARGYIARRTVLRSMQIRKALSKEVLRIAERYLQHGDLWGFLKEINSELERSNQVIKENQAREDNWAQNFVEKVIHKRQAEFNVAWEEFPKALRDFNGKVDNTGVLMTKQGTERKAGGSKTLSPQKHGASPMKNSGAASAVTLAGGTTGSAVLSPMKSTAALSASISSTRKGKKKGAIASTSITADEVGAAMAFEEQQLLQKEGPAGEQAAHLSVPGAMMRKALGTTVQAQVAEELNKLINGQYRSKQLVKAIKDVYGPHSDPKHKPGAAPKGGATRANTLAPLAGPPGEGARRKKKKKRVGLHGEILQDVGRIEAAHSDWLTAAATAQPSSSAGSGDTTRAGSMTTAPSTVEPGNSLLIDIPQGINDSIERLMHAAALRCYVPDFLQGVSSAPENGADSVLEGMSDAEMAQMDEAQLELLLQQRKHKEDNSINKDANYAYNMYLSMPFGLAKMRYEVQCHKFAQGPINRLRLKGLSYLSDVQPVSKFIMCLTSVETPRVLLNKSVDLLLELKNMGKTAPLGKIDRNSVNKFHRSVHTSVGSLPALAEAESAVGDNSGGQGSPSATKVRDGALSPALKTGEIGFESVATLGEIPAGGFNDSVVRDGEFADTVEGRAAQRQATKHRSELPGKMLLSMVENQDRGSWCDLRAPLEDIFLQAAFLVVPHVSYVPDLVSGSGSMTGSRLLRAASTGSMKMKRIESPMGNIAFKQHTAEVLKMTDEAQKREAVKERFRAAFILTTPFTLFLKSKRVYTVDDLLRVNLRDLQMPPALETQLEVLLTAVVSKCVDAKIVSVPRDHVSTAQELFTVPMFYDPKFQRSPFDPFGRPPRLQQKGSQRLIQKKLKAIERRENTVNKAHNNLNKVASVQSIQEDLKLPVTLWTTSQADGGGAAEAGETESGDDDVHRESLHDASKLSLGANLLDDSVVDGKWSFHGDNADTDVRQPFATQSSGRPGSHSRASSAPTEGTGAGTSTRPTSSTAGQAQTAAAKTAAQSSSSEKVRVMMENMELTPPTDSNIWKKSLRTYEGGGLNTSSVQTHKPRQSTKQFSQDADLMTRNIEDKVFKYSFVCTHPHCGQVFARQYTYNIHLKSHELFGQYHDYKRQPQLYLDKDRAQIAATKQKQYEERISLPPVAQAELQSYSQAR